MKTFLIISLCISTIVQCCWYNEAKSKSEIVRIFIGYSIVCWIPIINLFCAAHYIIELFKNNKFLNKRM